MINCGKICNISVRKKKRLISSTYKELLQINNINDPVMSKRYEQTTQNEKAFAFIQKKSNANENYDKVAPSKTNATDHF